MTFVNQRIDRQLNFSRLLEVAPKTKVLVIGALNVDEIFFLPSDFRDDSATYVAGKQVVAGGHAGNAASAFAQLGMQTSILGAIGVDSAGSWLLDDLSQRGIETSLVRVVNEPTGRAIIPVFSNCHFMILERGANEHLGDIPNEALADFDAIALFDPPLSFLKQLVSLLEANVELPDVYWTPGGHYASHEITSRLLPLVHCIFLNSAETESVKKLKPNPLSSAHRTTVVETRGAKGAAGFLNGESYLIPGFATECVDPTGAGDLFASCFILADKAGLTISDCLTVGNAGGMIAVETIGARSSKFDLDYLLDRLYTRKSSP
ncbi:hypothetical protein J5289_18775 [Rhizobium sp. B230/85]|uniref:carbohydrate kinase family protein n=1 Tax=unclassified Rhizobium TaxID=2613769 RepID=UPI001ADB3F69|nr:MULTISPECIES: PfkB family carbohydrate kinase [unclassified Rhizobium]MBO9136978.1 hypothetical protein [Rhizobium sp. B209b/85]QXZ98616.1 hypothetical protein J5289_18775 [Rhizobium sp. B230/85]